jgi:hypothetical protein
MAPHAERHNKSGASQIKAQGLKPKAACPKAEGAKLKASQKPPTI